MLFIRFIFWYYYIGGKMKIIVVSDSHGKDEVLADVLQMYPNADAYIHCGDIETAPSTFPQLVSVSGNNDLFFDYPQERIVELGGHRIYVVHSHQFVYSHRVESMAQKAKELQCDIVCFGHTHVAFYEICEGVHVLNPGSLWRSRDGRGPSYAILNVEDKNVDVEFVFLPQKKNKFFW